MNINEKAIEMFEQNEYEEAMELFQQAVRKSRDVQSLNNLAWMYLYEEENDDKALELIREVVKLNPSSYFPYNILGEIYMKQKKWEEAKEALQKSISIQPSNEAYHNVAVAHYNLGELEKALEFFLRVAGDSDYIMYNYVKCLIDLGRTTEAKEKLDAFNRKSDNFVGEINVADLYVELNCYKEAIEWFEKGYKEVWKSPNWIGRFVYALYKANNFSRINEVIRESIEAKTADIEDVQNEEVEENWTEKDKKELIEEYTEENNCYKKMIERIKSGYVPGLEFETDHIGACYLFGCKRHNHLEYEK
ncbi:tetratricopeptide repeat protein [Bacillus nitratireducens]|uniref:Tetratricopeptide repeat protein n=1 Tax=Bacillus nitratireducens TaxID=2026193 RepID=A0ABU6PBE3_9BACI|nr:tetratricopeptide repeat protein [Bacillus nitratireducens]MDR4171720.1 tetratricopeptide repeat protein [Bacillus nitratireducens]MED4678630.1 tetratricopeptide repeat protein [Bacillus nitratireducens]